MISDNFSEFTNFSFLHNLTWNFKGLHLVACKFSYLLKNKMAAFVSCYILNGLKSCFIFV